MSVVIAARIEDTVLMGSDSQRSTIRNGKIIPAEKGVKKIAVAGSNRAVVGSVGTYDDVRKDTVKYFKKNANVDPTGLLNQLKSGRVEEVDYYHACRISGINEYVLSLRESSTSLFYRKRNGEFIEIEIGWLFLGSGGPTARKAINEDLESYRSFEEIVSAMFNAIKKANKTDPACSGFNPVHVMEKNSLYSFDRKGKVLKLY